MTVTKTHFAYRIDRRDADGNSIMEHVAGCDDLTVAVAAHDAAVRRWAGEVIALLHSARVIEDSRQNRIARDGYVGTLPACGAIPARRYSG
jgi:hypothetical protein